MSVSGVYNNGINTGINKSGSPFHRVESHSDPRSNPQPTLLILRCIRLVFGFGNIFVSDKPHQPIIGVDHRKFFNFVLLKNFGGSFQVGCLTGRNQVFPGHHFTNKLIHVAFKTQVTVGHYPNQRIVLNNDRDSTDLIFSHHFKCIGNCFLRMDTDGIQNHAVFRTFYRTHLFCLIVNGHVFMYDPHTPFTGNSYGHSRFRNGIHSCRHHRDVKRDISGKMGGEIYVSGKNFGITGDQQQIVESQPFHCNFICNK
ncbi:hypothetical protein SDC9_73844 [bioreactor metagenome]|uniref:Uncharacterized protein n=1 Tax=bioreactor metagenome TaxID=1076179 RepID=A0A644YMK1_9ZZZZ